MEIKSLKPVEIWRNFTALNAVPRGSKKEEKVIKFMLDFGRDLGLETHNDEVGNVLIRKPATEGMEDRKTVVLQSHLDMVHQKNAETDFNFDTQGIQMFVDNGWVKAKGTTLGADNGIGVAAIMAVLESTSLEHPAIEALFTIDEETGMTGAMGLKPEVLGGEILLNLDTEEDDEIDIGCAGGVDIIASAGYASEPTPPNALGYRIAVTGLKGGHSGMDIHLGLGNANKIMNRLLYRLTEVQAIHINEIDGGGLRNAIPRESFAVVALDGDKTSFESGFSMICEELKEEFKAVEPFLAIQVEKADTPETVMEMEDQLKLLKVVYGVPNGVYRMSPNFQDLVLSSNNLARVLVRDKEIHLGCLTRSSSESSKKDLASISKAVMELGGYEVVFKGDYPGWDPNPDSEILKVLTAQYKQLFKDSPRVVACHAGLECGILGQHYPQMDMISFGPTIHGAHSPDERVNIDSVNKFWVFLKAILKQIPAK